MLMPRLILTISCVDDGTMLWIWFVLCGPERQHRVEWDWSATRSCGHHKMREFGLKQGSNSAVGTGCHTPLESRVTATQSTALPVLKLTCHSLDPLKMNNIICIHFIWDILSTHLSSTVKNDKFFILNFFYHFQLWIMAKSPQYPK